MSPTSNPFGRQRFGGNPEASPGIGGFIKEVADLGTNLTTMIKPQDKIDKSGKGK
jgi:hypothetical protein